MVLEDSKRVQPWLFSILWTGRVVDPITMITCEAEGRNGTEPDLKNGHGECRLTQLTASILASGPTNWRAVAPLMPMINPYMMSQKPIPAHFFRMMEDNAEDPSLSPVPASLIPPDSEFHWDPVANSPTQWTICCLSGDVPPPSKDRNSLLTLSPWTDIFGGV